MALVCRKNRFTRYGAKNCTEHPSCRAIRTQYKLATDLFSPSETLQPSDIPIEQVKHVLCSACCFLVSHRPMFSFPPFLLFSPSSSFFTIEGSHSLAANLQQGNVIAFLFGLLSRGKGVSYARENGPLPRILFSHFLDLHKLLICSIPTPGIARTTFRPSRILFLSYCLLVLSER